MVFVETINVVDGQVVQRCPVDVVVSHLRQECIEKGVQQGKRVYSGNEDDNSNDSSVKQLRGG